MAAATPGDAVVVALDHGLHWGVYEGFEDPEALLSTVLEADPDGVIASVPFLERFQDHIEAADVYTVATLDLLYDSTLPGQHEDAEIHAQVFDAGRAASVADAAKVALVYGRDDPAVLERNAEFVADAGAACRDAGIPLVVEPTLWGNRVDDEFDPDLLRHACRLGFELGADVLKSPYPADGGGFDRLVGDAPVPVYIAGGPAVESDREMLGMVQDACDAGARGVMFGRNVWQRPDPGGVIDALRALVHEGATVEDAETHL